MLLLHRAFSGASEELDRILNRRPLRGKRDLRRAESVRAPSGESVSRARKVALGSIESDAIFIDAPEHLALAARAIILDGICLGLPNSVKAHARAAPYRQIAGLGAVRIDNRPILFKRPASKHIPCAHIFIRRKRFRLAIRETLRDPIRRHYGVLAAVRLEPHRVRNRRPDGIKRHSRLFARGEVIRDGRAARVLGIAILATRPAVKNVSFARESVGRELSALAIGENARRHLPRSAVGDIVDAVSCVIPHRAQLDRRTLLACEIAHNLAGSVKRAVLALPGDKIEPCAYRHLA